MHFLPEFVTFFVFATLSKEVLLSVSENYTICIKGIHLIQIRPQNYEVYKAAFYLSKNGIQ